MAQVKLTKFIIEGQEEGISQEGVMIERKVQRDLFHDEVREAWTDLQLYSQDHLLHWLNKPGALANFFILCGYYKR